MNTNHTTSLFRRLSLLVVVGLLMLTATSASAVVTNTLMSEHFDEGYVPANGWNSYYNSYGGGNGYNWSYWSKAGANDYDGSWVFNLYDCDQDYIYSPTMNASAYTGPSDKVYVEFDAWIEFNGYDNDALNNNGQGGAYFAVYADNGSGAYSDNAPLLEYTHTDDVFTFDNRYDYSFSYPDPIAYSGYWKHYKLLVPASQRYASLDFYFIAYANWNCNGGNIAIDNVTVTGEQGQNITFAPLGLSFPTTNVGATSASQCVTITNQSSADIAVGSSTLGGLFPGDYVITGAVPTVIPAYGSIDVCVAFRPTKKGNRNANLQISNSSDNNPLVTVDLNGTGIAPLIEVTGLGLHNNATRLFSQAFVKLGDTLEQKVLVHNIGDAPLTINPSTFINGDYPGEYFISSLPSKTIGVNLYDTIKVKFSPSMEGIHTAKLNIVSNATNGTKIMDLKGIGVLPRIVAIPSTLLRYDSVAIGDSVCKTLTIYNPGSDTLKILNQVISSGEGDFKYSLIPSELTAIAPDKTRDINICFKPRQAGARSARITFITNIPKTFEGVRRDTSSLEVNMTGTGVPYGSLFIVSSNTGGLDSTIIGTQICRVDTIFNNGTADLLVNSLNLTGANASEFTYSGVSVPFTIKAKNKVAVTICEKPTARGLRQGALTVNAKSNDKTLTTQLPLAVFGQLVCANAAPNALFTDQKVIKNTDSTICVTVTNCGDVVANYTPHIGASTSYTVTPPVANGIQPGMTATFCVKFSPTTIGAETSSLTISSSNLTDMSVALNGVGACARLTSDVPTIPATNAGGHGTFIVTLTNSGNIDWNPGVPSITPAGVYSFTGTAPIVPASGNAQVTFHYDPTGVNSLYAAQITFPNAGPCTETPLSINVSQQTGTASVSQKTEQDGFSLEQNYPNPTVGSTSFNFTLPTEALVKLTVSDLTGHQVREIISGRISAGMHLVNFDASNLASGTYVYTLESSGVRLSRYLVLSK